MRTKKTVLTLFMSMMLACVPFGGALADQIDVGDLTSAQVDVPGEAVATGEGETAPVADEATPTETVEAIVDSDVVQDEVLPVVDLAKCTVEPIETETFTEDEAIEPEVTLIYRGKIDADDTDATEHEFSLSPTEDVYNIELNYVNNEQPGTATIEIVANEEEAALSKDVSFIGKKTATFIIEKASNSMSVVPTETVSVKYSAAKQTIDSPLNVEGEIGTLTFTKVSGKPYFSINKKTGDVTVAAKTPVGKYKVKLRVSASGDNCYLADADDEVITVQVKKGGANALSVAPVKKTVSANSKKNTTVSAAKAFKVKKNTYKAKVAYKKVSGNSKISVSSTGKITVKKGLAKGKTYPVKVKVTTKATKNFGAGSTTCTFNVKVKK